MLGMHTLRPGLNKKGWSVGYWRQLDDSLHWEEICSFSEIEDAVHRVSILNGGIVLPPPRRDQGT